jgi:hypothetical protein
MSEKDYQKLMELADELLKKAKNHTKEEALQSLIRAGIFDKDGNYTENYPALAAWSRRQNFQHV